jgi:CubicO group peptidase (beta-lactamase class C family)
VRDLGPELEAVRAKHNVPALCAVVVEGFDVTSAGVAGVRANGGKALVTIDDRWHLGSCTKAMTATLCATMVERGEVSWETTLGDALPDLRERMNSRFKAVTLAQLCTNRAGVPASLDAGGLWGRLFRGRGTAVEQRRMLAEGVLTRPPAYAPGTKDVYSNAGFALVGHALETVAGKPYEALMQERLFTPLRMTTCGWGAPGTPGNAAPGERVEADEPRGHGKDGKPLEPDPAHPSGAAADNPVAISPAGRLHCTIGDWAKFVSVHLRGDARNPRREARLLKAETFDRLHTPPDGLSGYAFGWGRAERAWGGPKGDRFVLTHAGSNTLWHCVVWVAPARDFAVLVCCNQGERGDKATDEVASRVIKGLDGEGPRRGE